MPSVEAIIIKFVSKVDRKVGGWFTFGGEMLYPEPIFKVKAGEARQMTGG